MGSGQLFAGVVAGPAPAWPAGARLVRVSQVDDRRGRERVINNLIRSDHGALVDNGPIGHRAISASSALSDSLASLPGPSWRPGHLAIELSAAGASSRVLSTPSAVVNETPRGR